MADGYLATSWTYTVKDTYQDYYQQAAVSISVTSGGKLTWKITMNNDRSGSKGRGVYLIVRINGTHVGPNKYTSYSNKSSTKWTTYPTGNNTSKSGSFNIGVGSFNVYIYVCCMQDSTSAGTGKSYTFTRKTYNKLSGGHVEIEDNFDNTFNLIGTAAKAETGNSIVSKTLKWTVEKANTTGAVWWTDNGKPLAEGGKYKTSSVLTQKNLKLADYKNPGEETGLDDETYRNVAAKVITVGSTTTDNPPYVYLDVRQNRSPKSPTGLQILPKTKTKLTVRDNWLLVWDPATPTHSVSPVIGYRLRLYKKNAAGKFIGLNLSPDVSDGVVEIGNGYADHLAIENSAHEDYYFFDTESNETTTIVDSTGKETQKVVFEINPAALGIVAGDEVCFGLFSYTRSGEFYEGNVMYFSDDGKAGSDVKSGVYTVCNAGIVRVKVEGTWREGQVWVKVDGVWEEATSVHTKVNGVWEEST